MINFEPLKKEHIRVLLRRHVTDFSELFPEESKEIFNAISKIKNRINRKSSDDAIIFINTGKHSSQEHLHIHVLPTQRELKDLFSKYENVPYRQDFPRKKYCL